MNSELELYIKDYKDSEIIIEGLKSKRISSGRVNPLKSSIDEFHQTMKDANINYEMVSWYPHAFIIHDDLSKLRELPIYKNGGVYIQSLSSMLPAIYLEPEQHKTILDMAAAPGGKTTLIAALTENKAQMTACEQNPIRIQKLKYNLDRQGVTCCTLIQKDARQLDEFFSFEQILLDAPCSGSGTLDFNRENKQFTKKLVDKSIKTQKELLKKAISMLKKNEDLVYSTCTILKDENENIIKHFLKEVDVIPLLPVNDPHMILLESSIDGVLTIAPNEYYEGFFIARLRKK